MSNFKEELLSDLKSGSKESLEQLDQEVENYLSSDEGKVEVEEYVHDPSLNPKQKKDKVKAELGQLVNREETLNIIAEGFALIHDEAAFKLGGVDYEVLDKGLKMAAEKISKLEIDPERSETFAELLNVSTESLVKIHDLGSIFFKEEQFDKAYTLFSLLTMLNPKFYGFWLSKGQTEVKLGNLENAAVSYLCGAQTGVDKPYPYLLAAWAFIDLGDTEKAHAIYDHLVNTTEKETMTEEELALFEELGENL